MRNFSLIQLLISFTQIAGLGLFRGLGRSDHHCPAEQLAHATKQERHESTV